MKNPICPITGKVCKAVQCGWWPVTIGREPAVFCARREFL